MGLEIYVSHVGFICLKQKSLENEEEVSIALSIGQLRSLIKNSSKLIDLAEKTKAEYTEGLSNETNS
jgi:hypothetical protein